VPTFPFLIRSCHYRGFARLLAHVDCSRLGDIPSLAPTSNRLNSALTSKTEFRLTPHISYWYICICYMGAAENSSSQPDLPDSVRAIMPMTPAVFYTLFALARDEQHGYTIMQSVSTLSEGAVSMGPGTLYLTIQRLVDLALIEETTQEKRVEERERRRRFYRITQVGRRAFELETQRMKAVLRQVRLSHLQSAGEEG
jgi:DNA-binding PadR family transcriptional regulator